MASLLDHLLISRSYFFPNDDEVADPCLIRTRDGHELRCAHLKADGPGTLLHFHGNGETASDWEPILGPFLAECGWSVVFVEYRGYGGSSGVPQLAAMLSDGDDVMQALGLKPEKVVAMGRSLGSLYAVELGRRFPLAGIILDSGINDVADRLLMRVSPEELGATWEAFKREVALLFDQSAKLSQFEGPVLILHARDDNLLDISHAERNAGACRQPTSRIFERGGHNAIYAVNQFAYQAAIREFLQRLPVMRDGKH